MRSPCTTFPLDVAATWAFPPALSRNPGIWCALPPARHQIPSWRCGELGFYQGPLPKSRNLVRASSQQCQRTQFHLPDPAKAQVAKSWLRPLALTRLGDTTFPPAQPATWSFAQAPSRNPGIWCALPHQRKNPHPGHKDQGVRAQTHLQLCPWKDCER